METTTRKLIRFMNRHQCLGWLFLITTFVSFILMFVITAMDWSEILLAIDFGILILCIIIGLLQMFVGTSQTVLRRELLTAIQQLYHDMILECITANRWDDAKYLYNNFLKDTKLRYVIHGIFVGILLNKDYAAGLDEIIELKFKNQ